MLSRRKFLGALAALPAVTALAGAGILLPRRTEVEVDSYLVGPHAWYIKTEPPDGFKYFNRVSPSAELTEKSLEDMLNQMRAAPRQGHGQVWVQPTKLIVPPNLAARAEYVLTHRPGLLERLWWRLTTFD